MRARCRLWDSFRGWVQRYGIPCSVYLDKHTTYRSPQTPTVEEQLQGHERGFAASQFQRAMSELGVEVNPCAFTGRQGARRAVVSDAAGPSWGRRNCVWLELLRWRRPTRFSNAIYRSTISVSRSRRLNPRTCMVGCRHDWISIRCFARKLNGGSMPIPRSSMMATSTSSKIASKPKR